MLAHLHVENFRSLEKLDLELPQVCSLVGPNNAGKSNVLEAIRRFGFPGGLDRVT